MSIEIDFLIIGDSSTYATWMEMKEINFVKNLSEARDVKAGALMGMAEWIKDIWRNLTEIHYILLKYI